MDFYLVNKFEFYLVLKKVLMDFYLCKNPL